MEILAILLAIGVFAAVVYAVRRNKSGSSGTGSGGGGRDTGRDTELK